MNGYSFQNRNKCRANGFKLAWIITLFILIFLFVTVHSAFAQEEAPPWLKNLDCEKEPQFTGVTYCTGKVSDNSDQENMAHVIVIDLHSPGVRLEYIIASGLDKNDPPDACAAYRENPSTCPNVAECEDVNRWSKQLPASERKGCDDPINRNYFPVMSLEQAVNRAKIRDPNVVAVIDSDYGARTNGGDIFRDHGPEGLTVVRGNRLDGPLFGDGDNNAVKRPWLSVSNSTPTPPTLRAEIHQLSSDTGKKPYDWIYLGVGGWPWLIRGGDVKSKEIDACIKNSSSCRDEASQVAVGLTQDGRWLFFVLAEKPDKGHNLLLGLANFMKTELNTWQAIKFDGGGSSQLWFAGWSENNGIIYREENRDLSQYLAILASPSEAVPEPAPQPEPVELPKSGWIDQWINWLQDKKTKIDKTWQELNQLISEAQQAIKDIQELSQNIQDPYWLFQESLKILLKCLGSAAIPALVAGVFWRRRRMKR